MNKLVGVLLVVVALLIGAAYINALPSEKSIDVGQNGALVTNLQIETQKASTEGSLGGVMGGYGRVTIYKTTRTGEKILVTNFKHNLIVNNGLNYGRQQMGSGLAVASNSTKYMSLSNDSTAPDAGETNIIAEITSNGFERAAAAYSENGTGAWDFNKTWTATGTQDVQKIGINYGNAANDGTLFAELTFTMQHMLVGESLTAKWVQGMVSS